MNNDLNNEAAKYKSDFEIPITKLVLLNQIYVFS